MPYSYPLWRKYVIIHVHACMLLFICLSAYYVKNRGIEQISSSPEAAIRRKSFINLDKTWTHIQCSCRDSRIRFLQMFDHFQSGLNKVNATFPFTCLSQAYCVLAAFYIPFFLSAKRQNINIQTYTYTWV